MKHNNSNWWPNTACSGLGTSNVPRLYQVDIILVRTMALDKRELTASLAWSGDAPIEMYSATSCREICVLWTAIADNRREKQRRMWPKACLLFIVPHSSLFYVLCSYVVSLCSWKMIYKWHVMWMGQVREWMNKCVCLHAMRLVCQPSSWEKRIDVSRFRSQHRLVNVFKDTISNSNRGCNSKFLQLGE